MRASFITFISIHTVLCAVLLEEDFESGVPPRTWDVGGLAVVDGNCGGANNTRLALCFFGGGMLKTKDGLLHAEGGELLSFFLRAGKLEQENARTCSAVEDPGQVMILEMAQRGAAFQELRRFDLFGWGSGWVRCEELLPKTFGKVTLRWRFEAPGADSFFLVDKILLVQLGRDHSLEGPQEFASDGQLTSSSAEAEQFMVQGNIAEQVMQPLLSRV